MLISLKSTLTQTRSKLDRVTFPCKGAHEELIPYVRIMVKFQFLQYHIQLVFLETKSLIIWNDQAYEFSMFPDSN